MMLIQSQNASNWEKGDKHIFGQGLPETIAIKNSAKNEGTQLKVSQLKLKII